MSVNANPKMAEANKNAAGDGKLDLLFVAILAHAILSVRLEDYQNSFGRDGGAPGMQMILETFDIISSALGGIIDYPKGLDSAASSSLVHPCWRFGLWCIEGRVLSTIKQTSCRPPNRNVMK